MGFCQRLQTADRRFEPAQIITQTFPLETTEVAGRDVFRALNGDFCLDEDSLWCKHCSVS